MAKIIKIPLDMNGVKVRTLESLQENFDLKKVLEYFVSGDLLKWLEGRYYEEQAEKVRNLSKDDTNLGKKLCRIFGVEYTEDTEIDLPNERLIEKTNMLKKLTTDEKIISLAPQVAFTQEDLAYILEEDDASTIYLCGEKFSIPASFEDRKYIGIFSKPQIKISIKTLPELKAYGITFENVDLPKNLMPPPAPKEIVQGYAIIKAFTKKGLSLSDGRWVFCGATIVRGKITLDSRVRVFRGNEKIHDGTIFALVNGDSYKKKFVDYIDDSDSVRDFDICFDKVRLFEKGDRIVSYVQATQEISEGIDLENIENLQGVGIVGSQGYGGMEVALITRYPTSHGRIFREGLEVYNGRIEWDGKIHNYERIGVNVGGVNLQAGDLIEFYPD